MAPLARLNAADGMATPKAQEAYEQYFETLGGKPVHHTLATHWARLIEMLYAAERMQETRPRPELIEPRHPQHPDRDPHRGSRRRRGAARHALPSLPDRRAGVITRANLIVATQNNAARIALSVDKAAKGVIHNGKVDDGILNMVEMAFRAYDPCHGCATHSLPGQMPLEVRIHNSQGGLVQRLSRFVD